MTVLSAQTTDEEYLYLTYGYKEQLLKGLDDKKGYSWKPLAEFKFSNESGKLMWKKALISKFEFEGLIRENETAPCAIVAIYKEKEDMKKRDGLFIPIPHADSGQDIIAKARKYFEEEIEFDKNILSFYSLGLSKLAVVLAQKH
jgi:hypothetical protein